MKNTRKAGEFGLGLSARQRAIFRLGFLFAAQNVAGASVVKSRSGKRTEARALRRMAQMLLAYHDYKKSS